jgi:hypothetical protein
MNDPKQQLLFTEWNHDDMDSDDYEEAYFNYLVDCLDKEVSGTEEEIIEYPEVNDEF